jgi:uncharacterized protein YbaP (TraB family)
MTRKHSGFIRFTAGIVSAIVLCLVTVGSLHAKPSSLLWKITGNGLQQPSYLYGTIHIKDKRVFNFSSAVTQAFSSTPAFAMEVIPDSADQMKLLPLLLLDEGQSLQKLLSAEDYAFVQEQLQEKLGPQALFMERLKPIFISSFVLLDNISRDFAVTVDEHFYKQAQEQKKTIRSIETVEEQLKALDAISLQEQADILVEQLRNSDKSDDMTDRMIDAYIAADLDDLMHLFVESEMPGAAYEALLTKRNHTMADRIAVMTGEQPVFAAIGAGHLAGDEGVIALLRSKGYTVEPVR